MAERTGWWPLPLVGRGNELAVARRGLDDAAAAKCGLVVITGGHGVGKTHLLEAIAEEATARGFALAQGKAYATDVNVPYALMSDALTPLVSCGAIA